MCGICGFSLLHSKADRSVIKAMNAVLKHRGPDQENDYVRENTALGHQRLSVIDLSTGDQPMTDASGRYTLVFNGEIYNFQELRAELEQQNCQFRTKSDTEVILQMYIQKGEACLSRFRGMFAFAIWDSKEQTMFCARDRVGKKPFYYALWNHGFYFASEIKSILQVPGFPRDVKPQSVSDFFAYTYIPYPNTVYHNVLELPPAHYLRWKEGKIEIGRYWELPFDKKINISVEEAADQLWAHLKKATQLRMISDVPLGAFLSGGIDSSTIVALMSELSSQPVKTFSIGFEEKEFNELPYAKMIADQFHTDHEEFVVRPNAMEMLPKIVWHYEQPFSDSSALPTFYVSQLSRRHVTVVLNGDGGDESFCGYMRYRAAQVWEFLLSIPLPIRKLIAAPHRLMNIPGYPKHILSRIGRFLECLPSKTVQESYLRYMIQFPQDQRMRMFRSEFMHCLEGHTPERFVLDLYNNSGGVDSTDKFQKMEIQSYLPCDLLTKMDRATMAYGLEARSPLLDHEVMEFAATLPSEYKINGNSLKHIMKVMMKDKVPAVILDRPKWGFGIPVSRWFRSEMKDYLKEVLLDPLTQKRPYFNTPYIEKLIHEHMSGRGDHGHRLWSLLVFELWHRSFIDSKPERIG